MDVADSRRRFTTTLLAKPRFIAVDALQAVLQAALRQGRASIRRLFCTYYMHGVFFTIQLPYALYAVSTAHTGTGCQRRWLLAAQIRSRECKSQLHSDEAFVATREYFAVRLLWARRESFTAAPTPTVRMEIMDATGIDQRQPFTSVERGEKNQQPPEPYARSVHVPT